MGIRLTTVRVGGNICVHIHCRLSNDGRRVNRGRLFSNEFVDRKTSSISVAHFLLTKHFMSVSTSLGRVETKKSATRSLFDLKG